MRVLVVCKRQYTGKDLLTDRYGRLFEIPAALARRGHVVQGLSLSYRLRRSGQYVWSDVPGLTWRSINAFPTGLVLFQKQLRLMTKSFKPDLIWASSDVVHIAAAAACAVESGVPLVVDMYDNYESFGVSRIIGATRLLKRSCGAAKGISTVSNTLRAYIQTEYPISAAASVAVVGNGVRKDIFRKFDREATRAKFNLPQHAFLIGTAGALTRDRGIGGLARAFHRVAARHPSAWLVLAGPRDRTLAGCMHERIVDLGVLPHADIAEMLSALDVGVVCNLDSPFGRYCFPLKLYEMLACGIPVLAAATGDVAKLLAPWPTALFIPGDEADLERRLERFLEVPGSVPLVPVPSWDDSTDQLLDLFAKV